MPSQEILQHALVTLAALAASAAVFRRVLGFVGTRARRTGCSCPSGGGACGTPGHGTAVSGERCDRAPRDGSYAATPRWVVNSACLNRAPRPCDAFVVLRLERFTFAVERTL